MKLRPRNILLGLPQKGKNTRLVEVVLSYNTPIKELRLKYSEKILRTIFETGAENLATNFINIKEKAYITFYLDMGKAKISAKELQRRLKNLGFITEVSVLEPKPLFLDAAHFPLTNGLERVCIISTNTLAQIHEEMINILGSGAFTILWHIGLRKGKMLIELIKKLVPADAELKQKEMLEAFKQLYQAGGWGIIEYAEINTKQKTGKIRVYHSIAESLLKKYDMPICYYVKGNLTALLQEVFGCEGVYLNEVKCMAMGDPYCEFEFEC